MRLHKPESTNQRRHSNCGLCHWPHEPLNRGVSCRPDRPKRPFPAPESIVDVETLNFPPSPPPPTTVTPTTRSSSKRPRTRDNDCPARRNDGAPPRYARSHTIDGRLRGRRSSEARGCATQLTPPPPSGRRRPQHLLHRQRRPPRPGLSHVDDADAVCPSPSPQPMPI